MVFSGQMLPLRVLPQNKPALRILEELAKSRNKLITDN
jgi:hypothetical protein